MGNLGPIISIIRISLRKRRKKGGRKCNVYETIGRVVLATRQPEIPWKQGRKKKKKKGSLLHGSQRANFIRQLFSLPRLWTIPPLPSSDNNTPTLPYNSKLLSSSREALTLPLREKWRPRGWIRDSRVGERWREIYRAQQRWKPGFVWSRAILWSRRNRCSRLKGHHRASFI